jgi:vitamin B12/bleomycin/antimicrobial peptide transport system ATP-binding/permease protein
MSDRSEPSSAPLGTATTHHATEHLLPQLLMMSRALWASPHRTKVLLLGLALFVVISATAYGQIKLNAWNQPFYDAVARKDLQEFLSQLTVFGVIAGALLVLNVAQMWLNLVTKIKLREGLVSDLLDQWLKPGRAIRLADVRDIGANPDQRIHEDARHLTELSADLGIGLLQSSLLLWMFIAVLWRLSEDIPLSINGRIFVIPGYMVWCALIYSSLASWLSWLIGHPLVRLNATRYAQEAELRFALVHVNEHIDSVSLYGGEEDEKQHLLGELKTVLQRTWRIANATTRLTWITSAYGWSIIIAPILIAAPGYFSRQLSFGALMMAVGAFGQVQQSLRWFIDNYSTIADWRATLVRISSFRTAAIAMDGAGTTQQQIEFVQSSGNTFGLENLQVATPSGCTTLSEEHVEITEGERVLIAGGQGVGKTICFRAIAGLWPWGSGRVVLPSSGSVMFVSSQPYLPLGTLRAALAYPSPATAFKDEALVSALQSSGLQRLSSELDRIARWERELAPEEQWSLVLARVVLHHPRFLVTDETLDALEEDLRKLVINLFENGLKDMAVINIGRHETDKHYFTRVLELTKDPNGRCFVPDVSVALSSVSK